MSPATPAVAHPRREHDQGRDREGHRRQSQDGVGHARASQRGPQQVVKRWVGVVGAQEVEEPVDRQSRRGRGEALVVGEPVEADPPEAQGDADHHDRDKCTDQPWSGGGGRRTRVDHGHAGMMVDQGGHTG